MPQIQNSSPESSLLDEALLGCSDAHCYFNKSDQLESWSDTFLKIYKPIQSHLKAGLSFREFLRLIILERAIANPPVFEKSSDLELWLDQQARLPNTQHLEFVHHVHDGRIINIKHVPVSSGGNFFVAFDITEKHYDRQIKKESSDKFQQFAELASDWFWELDKNLVYYYHSNHNQRLPGVLQAADCIGLSRIEDMNRSNALRDQNFDEHQRALAAGEPFNIVLTVPNADGEANYVRIKGQPRLNDAGEFIGYMGCGRDVSETYRLQNKLEYLISHDDLTGLKNRRAIYNTLQTYIDSIHENQGNNSEYTLALIDVDHFKAINDEAGHQVGDMILLEISAFLSQQMTNCMEIARMGGDEFVILLDGSTDVHLERLQNFVAQLCELRIHQAERVFQISVSAGLAQLDASINSPDELMQLANIACHSSKLSGRKQLQVYSPLNIFQARQQAEIEKLPVLKNAIRKKSVSLFLQPIMNAITDTSTPKYEVLMRLHNEDGDLVLPGEYISVAEKYELMPEIDLIVIENAVDWSNRFAENGHAIDMSINLSGTTLGNQAHLTRAIELLQHSAYPELICIEITETTAINNLDVTREFMQSCRQIGCRFSLDDFGAGMSSYAYLMELQADYLKIDGCFIKNILEDKSSQAIVKSFITLAHELEMSTVAEFVETQSIADYLGDMGIDYLQGFGLGKPSPVEEWYEFLSDDAMGHTGT